MTDVIDQAQQYDALNLAQALEVQEAIARNTLRPTPQGHCLNEDCEADFGGDESRLFCGPACAEVHRHHERLRAQTPQKKGK